MFLSTLQDEFTKISAFVFKNWIMAKRNIFGLFEVAFWPLISFLSVGFLSDFVELSPAMKGFILIGVVAMNTIQVCQLDMAYVLLYDIWSKSLKHSFVAPIGIRHVLLGSMIIGIIRGGIVFFVLALLGQIVFHYNIIVPDIFATTFFLSGLFLNAVIIGILVSILVLLVGYKAEVAAWSVVSIMFLICGIYYPISVLPYWAQAMAKALPLTYFLEYYRSFYGFEPFCSSALLKGCLLLFVYLILEVYLMYSALLRAKKNGMLLKLSE